MINPAYFCLILFYQFLGEWIRQYFSLPLPGAIIGMLLLLASLNVKPCGTALKSTADGLIRFLPLFFIPAGVGVMAHLDEILTHSAPLLAALLIGTPLGILATLMVFRIFPSLPAPDDSEKSHPGS